MKNLGFGMMRLPVIGGDPTNFDYEQLNTMVDAFLAAGYTYFDTSFVYHNGKSEEATRKAVVERHPRDSFTVATKFPTFLELPEEKIEETFHSQLSNLGVEYVDYYLLHILNTKFYNFCIFCKSFQHRIRNKLKNYCKNHSNSKCNCSTFK